VKFVKNIRVVDRDWFYWEEGGMRGREAEKQGGKKQGIEKNGVREFEIGDWKFELERDATHRSELEGWGARPYLGSAWKRSTFRSDIAQGRVYIMHN